MSAPLYEGTLATIEIVLGSAFIATIAGAFLSLLLFGASRHRKLATFFLPLRLIVSLVGSYPLILFALLLLPWSSSLYGSTKGASNGQLILTIWGVFFFAYQILSRISAIEEEEALPIAVLKGVEALLIALLAGSATLGLLKMGGLVAFVLDLSMPIVPEAVMVVAVIYLCFLMLIKMLFGIMLSILRQQLVKGREEQMAAKVQERFLEPEALSRSDEVGDIGKLFKKQDQPSDDQRRENLPNDLDYLIRNRRS